MVRLVSFPFKLSDKDEARFDNSEHQLAELEKRGRIMTPRQQKRYDQLMQEYNEERAIEDSSAYQYHCPQEYLDQRREAAKEIFINICCLDNSHTCGDSIHCGSFVDGIYVPDSTAHSLTSSCRVEGFEEDKEEYVNGPQEVYKSPVESHTAQFRQRALEEMGLEEYESSSEESFDITEEQEKVNMALWMELLSLGDTDKGQLEQAKNSHESLE